MKNILIAFMLLIVVPLAVLFGMYTFYEPFSDIVNETMAKLPGGLGGYFRSIPTKEDDAEQLVTIASYLLDIEMTQAVDKLNLIENEDLETFDSVVKSMIRLNPSRTERILEEKRKQSLKPNVIQSTLDQISDEQVERNQESADVIAKLPLAARLETFNRLLEDRVDAYEYLGSLVTLMAPEVYGEMLEFLDEEAVKGIRQHLSEEMRLSIDQYVSDKNQNQSEVFQTAQILVNKPISDLATTLVPGGNYSTEDLVSIYQTLGPKRAGEVLAKIDNDTFAFDLVNAIKAQQTLTMGEDKFTGDLLKSLNIYKAYDDNINDLVNIYNQVDDSKTADIIKRLYWYTGQVKRYPLSNGEEIALSDQDLALDILKSFPPKKIASILSYLDNSISTEISTKLALPNLD